MIIDLRKGFGDFPEYKLFKFPDNSIKFELKYYQSNSSFRSIEVITTLRTNDDIITLALLKDTLDRFNSLTDTPFVLILKINYMMYQQDDRLFNNTESFGLKVICNFINSMNWKSVSIFHPHSDKVEMINNCHIFDNQNFIEDTIRNFDRNNTIWVIPDSGAFKTQFKQIQNIEYPEFITCMKSRNHNTGEVNTIVNSENLQGKDCFIVDDICLGGRTFIQIAEKLKRKNCGKLYLIISHGIFNNGLNNLYQYFDCIYTTDSICTLQKTEKLKIYKL